MNYRQRKTHCTLTPYTILEFWILYIFEYVDKALVSAQRLVAVNPILKILGVVISALMPQIYHIQASCTSSS